MKTLPQPKKLPAHYMDQRTQQMRNDAVVSINYHTQKNSRPKLPQKQVEKELNLFYKQNEALDSEAALHLTTAEKQTLKQYFKTQINKRTAQLDVFINGAALTARAINKTVVEPETV